MFKKLIAQTWRWNNTRYNRFDVSACIIFPSVIRASYIIIIIIQYFIWYSSSAAQWNCMINITGRSGIITLNKFSFVEAILSFYRYSQHESPFWFIFNFHSYTAVSRTFETCARCTSAPYWIIGIIPSFSYSVNGFSKYKYYVNRSHVRFFFFFFCRCIKNNTACTILYTRVWRDIQWTI